MVTQFSRCGKDSGASPVSPSLTDSKKGIKTPGLAGGHKMHVFIDESGSFTGFHAGSISVVGALAIPDEKVGPLKKKYAKIRARLPLEKGEVKGRLLNE